MATAASISSSGGVAAAAAAISAISVPAETAAFRGAAYFLGKASWTKGYR